MVFFSHEQLHYLLKNHHYWYIGRAHHAFSDTSSDKIRFYFEKCEERCHWLPPDRSARLGLERRGGTLIRSPLQTHRHFKRMVTWERWLVQVRNMPEKLVEVNVFCKRVFVCTCRRDCLGVEVVWHSRMEVMNSNNFSTIDQLVSTSSGTCG